MEEMTINEICQALKLTGLDTNIVGLPSNFESIPVLSPPNNVVATVSGSDIVITWDAASSVDGYNIYQSIDSGTWTKLNATTETGLTYTLTPTDPGEYNFYVTSIRGDKESPPSAETTTTEAMMTQVYTDTLSPRISAVDGTAFVDDTAAITTYADGNHLLEVQDSAGTVISGVLKAQGTGETLGSKLVTNGDFSAWTGDDPDGWSHFGQDATNFITEDPAGQCRIYGDNTSAPQLNQDILTLHGLFKHEFDVTAYVSGGVRVSPGTDFVDSIIKNATGSYSEYRTARTDTLVKIQRNGGVYDFTIDNFSSKQVLTPSTSGATLVDEISGTTQNLFTAPAGFIFNQASYTVRVKKILPTA